MRLQSWLLIGILACSQLLIFGHAEYRGTVFGRANFDFSIPFVFGYKYDSLEEEPTILGDYYFDQFSVPFHVSLELAYQATFTQEHRLVSLWKVKYSDDPVNFFFTEDTKSKINATHFNSQNLNNFLLIKYIWNINPYLTLSPSFHASFDFNRDSRLENFLDNYYNAQIYGTFFNFKIRNLGDSASALQRMLFDFDLGYNYNYLPNSEIIRNSETIPDTKEDFHSIDFTFKYLYNLIPHFFLSANYRLNFKSYAMKPVYNEDFSGYSERNQKDILNNLDLAFSMGFADRGDYRIFNMTTAYTLKYLYSTHVELMEISRDLLGKYPLPDSTIEPLNNAFTFYLPDFRNYLSNIVGLYFKFNINANHGFQLGYTFGIKYFFEDYGKEGTGLSTTSQSSGNVSTSGTYRGTTIIDSYGIYSDEKRKDIYHTVSFGYAWKSTTKDRLLYPYLGLQKSDSNDHTKNLNRYIFIIGTKVNYEF